MRHLMGQPHSQKHVRGLERPRGTGAARRGRYPLRVQIQQEGLPLYADEAEVRVVGQPPVTLYSIQFGVGDPAQDAVDQPVPKSAEARLFLGQARFQPLDGGTEPHDARQVLGAGTPSLLLTTAMNEILEPQPLAQVEGLHFLGVIHFVRGQGQHVNSSER